MGAGGFGKSLTHCGAIERHDRTKQDVSGESKTGLGFSLQDECVKVEKLVTM